jgi:cytochrome P450
MERVFTPAASDWGEQSIHISERLIRELYRTMLDSVLGVTVLKPLDDYITCTRFPRGSRPLALEGVMYSFRLHLPFLRPIRYLVDRLFFRKVLYMKRVSATLVQMVCDFTVAKPGSLFSTLVELKASGKITRAQFRGEVNSMLVSAFSLASAMASALLCLAARPRYQKRIHDDPDFAKCFAMEVLRLYPPFRQFGYEKAVTENGSQSSDSAGDEFMVAVFALHRNSDVWENPHKFYPERFLDPREMGGFKYMPFGMGKRACLGRRFSMSLIVETLKFVCSDESRIALVKRDALPRGRSGRLVSFALDDTLTYCAR